MSYMTHKPNSQELVQRILSGTRWVAMLRLTAQTFSWISTIIVVRFISPLDYGLNTMLEAPLGLMLLVSTLGLDVALVQSDRLERIVMRSAFGWLLIINGVLFLAYFFGGSVLATYFNEPSLDALAKTLAFVFLLAPFRVIPNALLDRELKFKLRAQVELVSTLGAVTLTLALAVLGAGVWALVIGVLANQLIQALILMIRHPWFVLPAFNIKVAWQLVAFGGITAIASAVTLLSGKLVHFIAGPELGAAKLGLYAVSLQFAMLPLAKFMQIINPTLLPAFSKFQDQRELATRYLEKSLGIASLAIFPAVIGMACIADAFVIIVIGPRWSEVAFPLALLSLMMPLRMITLFLRPVMTSMGRADLALKSSLTLLCLLPPLTLIGIQYGVFGLVAAWLVAEPLVALNTMRLSRHALPTTIRRLLRSVFPALACSAIMAAAVLGLRASFGFGASLVELMGAVAAGAFSYYLALKLLFPERMRDTLRVIKGKSKGKPDV